MGVEKEEMLNTVPENEPEVQDRYTNRTRQTRRNGYAKGRKRNNSGMALKGIE